VKEYWVSLAALSGFCIEFDSPSSDSLVPSIDELWRDSSWLRFSVTLDPAERAANGLLFQAASRAEEFLSQQREGHTQANVWTRVPEWRCLCFMFWHEEISDAYLLVEHFSGDAAGVEDVEQASLTEVLG
jgi:hypothetical protein